MMGINKFYARFYASYTKRLLEIRTGWNQIVYDVTFKAVNNLENIKTKGVRDYILLF